MTDAQLLESWVQHAANALALMILEIQDSPMEGGTLYHAVHALRLYAARKKLLIGPSQQTFNLPCPLECFS